MTAAIYLISVLTMGLIRLPHLRGVGKEEILLSRKSVLEMFLILQFGLAAFVLPLVAIFTRELSFADYELPEASKWIGAALCGWALWLFLRSHATLGLNWFVSLELRKGHELVTTGVYRRIRHPMYAAIWGWCLAQPLVFHNWIVGWAFSVSFGLMYFLRVPREEQMMVEHFGQEYVRYMARTGRVIPKIGVGSDFQA